MKLEATFLTFTDELVDYLVSIAAVLYRVMLIVLLYCCFYLLFSGHSGVLDCIPLRLVLGLI